MPLSPDDYIVESSNDATNGYLISARPNLPGPDFHGRVDLFVSNEFATQRAIVFLRLADAELLAEKLTKAVSILKENTRLMKGTENEG